MLSLLRPLKLVLGDDAMGILRRVSIAVPRPLHAGYKRAKASVLYHHIFTSSMVKHIMLFASISSLSTMKGAER